VEWRGPRESGAYEEGPEQDVGVLVLGSWVDGGRVEDRLRELYGGEDRHGGPAKENREDGAGTDVGGEADDVESFRGADSGVPFGRHRGETVAVGSGGVVEGDHGFEAGFVALLLRELKLEVQDVGEY
jgi:hypothetical protein